METPKTETLETLVPVVFEENEMLQIKEEYDVGGLQLQTILNTYGKGMNKDEFMLFLSKAKKYDLSIERGEIRGYKDKSKNIVMFAGRDGFRTLAQRHSEYAGLVSCEVCANDRFIMDIANNKIVHEFGTSERGEIIGAYAIAKTKTRGSTIERADIKTYDKKQFTWSSHKAEMIKKIAETHVLKKTFNIGGLYTEEEIDISGSENQIKNNDNGLGSTPGILVEKNEVYEEIVADLNNVKSKDDLGPIGVKIRKHKDKLGKFDTNNLLLQRSNISSQLNNIEKIDKDKESAILSDNNEIIEGEATA